MMNFRFFFFFLILFSQSIDLHAKKAYLSVCAIFRDEARFLKEWIEFHKLMGVERFYLLNNLSQDDYMAVLKPYIQDKTVLLYQWNFETSENLKWPKIQMSAYRKILKIAKRETEWLAIIDTDEFLFPVEEKTLVDFLKKYERFAAVCANWQLFGTSGVRRIADNELLIEKLNLKAPENYPENIHVKSIVKPRLVKKCDNPHYCKFYAGSFQVNEDKIPFEGPFSPYITVNQIRINHYWSRDEEFLYETKIARRGGWNESAQGVLKRNENINKEYDDTISRFIDPLKEKMLHH